jgi:hypothetical protein
MVEIYACDYFNSPPELVQRLNGVNEPKLKCDNCREFKQGVEEYLHGDRLDLYCTECATELGEV